MKKIIYSLTTILVLMSAFSCCQNLEPKESQDSITIDFATDDELAGRTKTSSTAGLSLSNGCTIAFYRQSDGVLLTKGSCSGDTRRIVISDAPSSDCNVYAVGNTSFDWPDAEASLPSRGIDINVMNGYIPRSTIAGDYSWNVGTSYMKVYMKKMYARICICIEKDGCSFDVASAKVLNCPDYIYPFGATSTGSSGSTDTASSQDVQILNEGNYAVLYVPSEGDTKVELCGTRRTGDGFDYTDRYIITVPAIDRDDDESYTIIVNGTDDPSQGIEVIIGGEDTRHVEFERSSYDVIGDGSTVNARVRGYADNGGKLWQYTVSWSGDSALEGNTTICGESLGHAGSLTLTGDGAWNNLNVVSHYSGSTQKTVFLYSGSAMAAVNIEAAEKSTSTVTYHFSNQGKRACGYKIDIYDENMTEVYASSGSYSYTSKTDVYYNDVPANKYMDPAKNYKVRVVKIYGSTTCTLKKYNGITIPLDGSNTSSVISGYDLGFDSGDNSTVVNLTID